MKPTKTDMARVIVQALYGLKKLPEQDNDTVQSMAREHNKDWFRNWYPKANELLQNAEWFREFQPKAIDILRNGVNRE